MPNWIKKEPAGLYAPDDDILTKLEAIYGIDDINVFLNPQTWHQHNPHLMKNAQEAAFEIIRAIQRGDRICISFDVDADGVTAGSIIYRYLSQFINLKYCYAERSDGHGIENQLDKIPQGTQTLIIVDSSSNSVDACKQLSEAGINIIILDHHPVNEGGNPYALLVNPQQEGCEYPNKELSGAGVVYKVLEIVDDSLCGSNPLLTDLVDLVAVGLSADMMSARDMENRYLISHGLRNIRNPGLTAILKVKKRNPKYVSSQDIGFTIGPFINGAARMGNLGLAIDLLLEDDEKNCVILAKHVQELNEQRKKIESETYERLNEQVEQSDKFVIVHDKDIDKSFNGLVATKFTNSYHRPAIVFQEQGPFLSGSYRGYADFDMKEFLRGFKTYMENYLGLQESESEPYGFVEGHPQAGGFGIYKNDLNLFKRYVDKNISDVEFKSGYVYDLELTLDDIDSWLMKDVEKFGWVSGTDHPVPKFLLKNLEVASASVIGSKMDTVKIECQDEFVVIKFRVSEPDKLVEQLTPGTRFNAIGALNSNYDWGKKKVISQLYLEDFMVI